MRFARWILCAAVMTVPVVAQEAITGESVMQRLCQFMENEREFNIASRAVMDVTGPRPYHDEIVAQLDLQRPNLTHTSQASSAFSADSVNNDKGFFLYLPKRKQCKVVEPKVTLADALNEIGGAPLGSDVRFLVYLLRDKPWETLQNTMSAITYVGWELVGDVSCHHVRLEEDELTWDVWVEDGDTPLLRRIQPDLSKFVASRAQQLGASTTATLTVDLTWTRPANLSPDEFSLTLPDGVLRVQEFQTMNPDGLQYKLLGGPAPVVQVENAEGKTETFKFGGGDKVTIIDFWAVWCVPCHKLMPILHRVSEDYADKGVEFLSIDVGDTPDAVAKLLKDLELEGGHVYFDPKHRAATSFGLEGFPLVILIGKDGTVQTIRGGYGPGYEEQLRKDLDMLVAGKPLIVRND